MVTVLFVVNRLCVVSFLFVVRRLCMVGSFFVVSRLALRWGAKQPNPVAAVFSRQNPMAGFQGRFAAQRRASLLTTERLCLPSGIGSPQRVCSPQQTTPLVLVEESRRVCGDCAFWGEPAVCGDFAFCNEQACPAPGREAVPPPKSHCFSQPWFCICRVNDHRGCLGLDLSSIHRPTTIRSR